MKTHDKKQKKISKSKKMKNSNTKSRSGNAEELMPAREGHVPALVARGYVGERRKGRA